MFYLEMLTIWSLAAVTMVIVFPMTVYLAAKMYVVGRDDGIETVKRKKVLPNGRP